MMASGAAPEPSRTLAVVFGASRWPQFPGLDSEAAAPAYLSAAVSFRDYLLSADGLGLPNANLLDLFDSEAGVVDQDAEIRRFIRKKCSGTATIQDLIVIFIGHGSTAQNNKFIFMLRSTKREQREISAYKSETLGRTLKDTASTLRKWVLLDCCAASAAYGDFQPASEPQKVMEDDAVTSFPPEGAAFYAACNSDDFAYNDPKAGSRMFTAALTDVLARGDPGLSERLTLSEVAALTLAEINRRHGPDGVRPYIGNPDQRKGELSSLPFFPNAARRKMSVEAQLESLQSSMSGLKRTINDRFEALERAVGEQKVRQDELAGTVLEQAGSVQPATLPAERASRASALGDIENRLPTLQVGEQRWWDEARSGYWLSRYFLTWSAILLMLEVVLVLAPLMMNGSQFAYSTINPLRLMLTVAAAMTWVISLGPVFRSKDVVMDTGSPELDAIVRTNAFFRRIYFGHYKVSFLGLLHRRLMAFTCILSMLATLLGAAILLAVAYL